MTPHPTASTWTLADDIATAPRAIANAPVMRLDLADPLSGLRSERDDARDTLLGLDLRGATRLVDRWARGGDLTAVYEPADTRALRATAMWRVLGHLLDMPPGVRAWEVIVSVQTSLLHSDPTMAVLCDLSGSMTLGCDADDPDEGGWHARAMPATTASPALLVRSLTTADRAPTTTLIAAHDSRGRCTEASLEQGRMRIVCSLFESTIEKGVLLRSRILAAAGPATDDLAWATRLLRCYRRLPPMLDT
jgi:hypothetical protein